MSLSFEVFGKVQGVFFRKFTAAEAANHGISGWCRNSSGSSVQGEIEGDRLAIDAMKHWLESVGSPQSRIDKCLFGNELQSETRKFNHFSIIK
jgi:acylphosphatase